MDIRENVFTEKVVKHWNGLLRVVVQLPFLKCSKNMDVALGDMVYW